MTAEALVDALLRVAPVQDVVGSSLALEQLPQGSAMPALVYRVVSDVPIQRLCAPALTHRARIQINPLAPTLAAVDALHALARAALVSFAPRNILGVRVSACLFEGCGPASKDDFTGMWTKSADYMLIHEE